MYDKLKQALSRGDTAAVAEYVKDGAPQKKAGWITYGSKVAGVFESYNENQNDTIFSWIAANPSRYFILETMRSNAKEIVTREAIKGLDETKLCSDITQTIKYIRGQLKNPAQIKILLSMDDKVISNVMKVIYGMDNPQQDSKLLCAIRCITGNDLSKLQNLAQIKQIVTEYSIQVINDAPEGIDAAFAAYPGCFLASTTHASDDLAWSKVVGYVRAHRETCQDMGRKWYTGKLYDEANKWYATLPKDFVLPTQVQQEDTVADVQSAGPSLQVTAATEVAKVDEQQHRNPLQPAVANGATGVTIQPSKPQEDPAQYILGKIQTSKATNALLIQEFGEGYNLLTALSYLSAKQKPVFDGIINLATTKFKVDPNKALDLYVDTLDSTTLTAKSAHKVTPYEYACAIGASDIAIKILDRGCKMEVYSPNDGESWKLAIKYHRTSVVDHLMKCATEINWSFVLRQAIKYADLHTAQHALKADVVKDAFDIYGNPEDISKYTVLNYLLNALNDLYRTKNDALLKQDQHRLQEQTTQIEDLWKIYSALDAEKKLYFSDEELVVTKTITLLRSLWRKSAQDEVLHKNLADVKAKLLEVYNQSEDAKNALNKINDDLLDTASTYGGTHKSDLSALSFAPRQKESDDKLDQGNQTPQPPSTPIPQFVCNAIEVVQVPLSGQQSPVEEPL